jgi:hypothetical protein
MEQRTGICFFTFKRLKARAINTELESVCGAEMPALPTVKKWWQGFHQRRTDLFDDPWPGRPSVNDFWGANGSIPE